MLNINDLRHSISTALNLGRYTIVVKTAGGEHVPASITLDLVERDDDGFLTAEEMARMADPVLRPTITPEGHALVDTVTDDHGPAIPAQRSRIETPMGAVEGVIIDPQGKPGPIVYEFALQDADAALAPKPATLGDVIHLHAPDVAAYCAADWVHVYDRVTRERLTLKRPEPDAVLSGLRDVAADLRKPHEPTESEVKQLFGTMPPVGPLTSTEGLKAGDVLRVVKRASGGPFIGAIVSVVKSDETDIWPSGYGNGWLADRFAFVARPGVWMSWEGGENPVPGLRVKIRLRSGTEMTCSSEDPFWDYGGIGSGGQIVAYMVVDTPSASSDT